MRRCPGWSANGVEHAGWGFGSARRWVARPGVIGDGFCDDAADFAQVKERRVFGAVSKSARCHDDGVFERELFGDFCREI